MITLLLGLFIFFSAHSISIINDAWRNRMVAKIGELPWKGLYTLLSIAGFMLIIWGYGMTRHDAAMLYSPPAWLSHVSMLLLVPVFPLLLAAYFPGRIKTASKHPMLLATKLWALTHLLANGTLPDVLLFGSFLAWAILDRISMKQRRQRPLPDAPAAKANDVIAVVVGLALYLAFVFWLHTFLIGIPLSRS